jgi:hypothetical protein
VYLGVEDKAVIKNLRAECDDLLSILEQHDQLVCSHAVLLELDGEAERAAQRLLDLGVIRLFELDRDGVTRCNRV